MKLLKYFLSSFFCCSSLVAISQNNQNRVSVVPNPSDSIVTFSIDLKDNDVLSFQLFDLLGNSMNTIEQKNYSESTEFSRLLSTTPSGVYFSRIEINEQIILNKLVFTGTDSILHLNFKINVSQYLTEKDKVHLFPNPVINENLHLDTKSNSRSIKYLIYNLQGQLILEKEVTTQNGYAKLVLPISNWQSGQYIVKMKSELGEAESTFIKIEE